MTKSHPIFAVLFSLSFVCLNSANGATVAQLRDLTIKSYLEGGNLPYSPGNRYERFLVISSSAAESLHTIEEAFSHPEVVAHCSLFVQDVEYGGVLIKEVESDADFLRRDDLLPFIKAYTPDPGPIINDVLSKDTVSVKSTASQVSLDAPLVPDATSSPRLISTFEKSTNLLTKFVLLTIDGTESLQVTFDYSEDTQDLYRVVVIQKPHQDGLPDGWGFVDFPVGTGEDIAAVFENQPSPKISEVA